MNSDCGILLWFKSKSGDETFSFDPGRVVLRFGGGEEVRLSSYGGPELLRVNPYSGTCFMLWFDTSAPPDRDFMLVLEQVKKAGERVAIPQIEFKKGSVRKYQQMIKTRGVVSGI